MDDDNCNESRCDDDDDDYDYDEARCDDNDDDGDEVDGLEDDTIDDDDEEDGNGDMDIDDDDVDDDVDDDDGDEEEEEEEDDSRLIESGDNAYSGPYEVRDDYNGEGDVDVTVEEGDEEEDEDDDDDDDKEEGDGEEDDGEDGNNGDDLELEEEGDDDDSVEDIDDNTMMAETDVGACILNMQHPLSVAPLGVLGDCEVEPTQLLPSAPAAYECVLRLLLSATSDGIETMDDSAACLRSAGWLSAVTRSPQGRVSSAAGIPIDSSDDLEMDSPYRALQSQSPDDSAVSRAAFQLLSSPLRLLSSATMEEEEEEEEGGGTIMGGAQDVFNGGLDDYFTAPNRIETGRDACRAVDRGAPLMYRRMTTIHRCCYCYYYL